MNMKTILATVALMLAGSVSYAQGQLKVITAGYARRPLSTRRSHQSG